MKTIDLSSESPTLKKLLVLAGDENLLLKTAEGRAFLLVELDDFGEEIARTRQNESLMRTLEERSGEAKTYGLSEVRKKLK